MKVDNGRRRTLQQNQPHFIAIPDSDDLNTSDAALGTVK